MLMMLLLMMRNLMLFAARGLGSHDTPISLPPSFRSPAWHSSMSTPVQFQLESGYQALPPRRRWDLCGAQLRQLERKHQNFRVIGREYRRCRAQEFLLCLWQDPDMAVGSGRSTLGSEKRKELKRLPSMVATKLDCQLV